MRREMTANYVPSIVNIENVERKIDSDQFWSKRVIVLHLAKIIFIRYKSRISGTNFFLLLCVSSVQALVFFDSTRFFKVFHNTSEDLVLCSCVYYSVFFILSIPYIPHYSVNHGILSYNFLLKVMMQRI